MRHHHSNRTIPALLALALLCLPGAAQLDQQDADPAETTPADQRVQRALEDLESHRPE